MAKNNRKETTTATCLLNPVAKNNNTMKRNELNHFLVFGLKLHLKPNPYRIVTLGLGSGLGLDG
ncbi:MAG: hypothetical protein N2748_03140 [candidate division WOR-3 bacterium]|nr:hypothetical protein [candidate division WOR-3 bacterium]